MKYSFKNLYRFHMWASCAIHINTVSLGPLKTYLSRFNLKYLCSLIKWKTILVYITALLFVRPPVRMNANHWSYRIEMWNIYEWVPFSDKVARFSRYSTRGVTNRQEIYIWPFRIPQRKPTICVWRGKSALTLYCFVQNQLYFDLYWCQRLETWNIYSWVSNKYSLEFVFYLFIYLLLM